MAFELLREIQEPTRSVTFYEEGSRLLTSDAFEFVLDAELKRAVRLQQFLTLALLEVSREWEGMNVTADRGTLKELAQIIAEDVRDTDVLGSTADGTLSLVLLDAGFEHSSQVIDRLLSRIEGYQFSITLRIVVGAACYPTHAVHGPDLKLQAASRPIAQWRGGPRQQSAKADQ